MKKELVVTGKTTELAVAEGCAELGVDSSEVTVEVLEEAKKGFLGMGATPARVKITYAVPPVEIAADFLKTLIANMEIEAELTVLEEEDGARIIISGEAAGVLIGHHGDTLDSLQYLVNLSANRNKEGKEYVRISLDIENYRAKREETLKNLAKRTAERVKRTRRSITLEPMTAQERRIIHSAVQDIEGVTTFSVGQETNRKVVIALDRKPKA